MRFDDWPERLAAFVATRRAVPFAYGKTDCGLTVADWVREATGQDPATDLRGRYLSAAGAIRAVREAGAADLVGLVTARLGPPVAPLMAQRGDIVEVPGEDGPALGICIGGDLVAMRPAGLATIVMANAVRAWRV